MYIEKLMPFKWQSALIYFMPLADIGFWLKINQNEDHYNITSSCKIIISPSGIGSLKRHSERDLAEY